MAPAIKALTSEQVMAFQQSGEVTVEGYVLSIEDIKVCMFVQFNLHVFATLETVKLEKG